jgi:GT2 family glycosyltransferase
MAFELDPTELQRRLAIRTAELAAAHRRIEELLEKANELKENKRKLKAVREERDALRASLEYRFGRKVVTPFKKLARALGGRRGEQAQQEPWEGDDAYHRWFLAHRASPEEIAAMRTAAEQMPPVVISIVMPAYNTPLSMLDEAVASVRAQVYPHWELVIVDDASDDPRVAPRLRELAAEEPRIRVKFLERNQGIALASNAAIAMASGEFVGLLDHDDWLEPDTLFEIARLIQETPEADLLYTDEDKVDNAGRFEKPFFKPDWSPDALLSNNYICHFTVLRRSLLEELGGFRTDFEYAQDYDLILRATERARRILHVPKILYHWRTSSHSTSGGSQQKPAMVDSGARAVASALARRGIDGEVLMVGNGARYRVRRVIAQRKKIAILIPTRDRVELLKRCVESIAARTDYPNYEIVIVDNDSRDPETLEYYETLPHQIVPYPGPFNYSAINNFAVRHTDAPWILFLNNDTEVINPEWLSSMAEHIQRPEVGVVGAKLLFPDDTVQHAGVLLVEKGSAKHAYLYAPATTMENGGRLQLVCNYSAVTAACMLTRREVFYQVGGFDEMNLPVTLNDVDYCLKVRDAGFLVVYTPFAQLYHYESASRGRGKTDPAEGQLLRQRWPGVLARDPYGNPNLGWDAGRYERPVA